MKQTSPTKQFGFNHPLPVPWPQLCMDLMMNLLSSAVKNAKYNLIMVVVDYLTKIAHLIGTTIPVDAEGLAKLYFDKIYKLHRSPLGICFG
jgi:hypothetical protein